MKLSRWALMVALAGMVMPGLALAQTRAAAPTRQQAGVQRTAYEYADYYSQEAASPSPSDAPAPAPSAAPAAAEEPAAAGCDSCGDDSCGDDTCGAEASEPWKLFDCCALEQRNIDIGGWIAASPFTWNPDNPANGFNGPVTWNDRSNEFQLNQLYWYAQRTVDTEGYGVDIGGRVDLLYGTDSRFTTATGLDNLWSLQNRFYGLAMPQLFAEVAANDWSVKLGHFYSPVGYEVVPTTGNFFSTLPYTFQYGEPFTHTGMLATYSGFDKLTLGSGFTRGWDNWSYGNPHLGYLGTATYSFEDESSLALVIVSGLEPNGGGAFTSRYLQTVVYSRPLTDSVNYVAQSDLGIQANAVTGTGNNTARWYGLNQYLFKTLNDQWTVGVRAEWFRDESGFRVGGFLPNTTTGSSRGLPTSFSGYAGSFYELTFGANWKPNDNLVIRPMIRWDWFSGQSTNAGGLTPFDDGTSLSQLLIGGDIILLY